MAPVVCNVGDKFEEFNRLVENGIDAKSVCASSRGGEGEIAVDVILKIRDRVFRDCSSPRFSILIGGSASVMNLPESEF